MLPVTFPYNKKVPRNKILWLTALLIGLTYFIIVNAHGGGVITWVIIGFCDTLTLGAMFYIYLTQLKPALQDNAALELNDLDLIFAPKNLTIAWKIVQEIELKADKDGCYLYVIVTDPTNAFLHARIDLDWVAGKPDDIYKTTLHHFHHVKDEGVK